MFGKRLKEARLAAGLSQEQLGALSGYSQQTINGMESGKISRPRRIDKLAAALGVSPSELLFGDDASEPQTRQAAQRLINKIQELDNQGLLNDAVLHALLNLLEAIEENRNEQPPEDSQ